MLWFQKRQSMSRNEIRYIKNSKILQELPWLWAIRSKWRLRYDEISIHRADEPLRQFLYQEAVNPAIELWAYIARICDQLEVERIDPRPNLYPLGVRIQDYVRPPEKVIALALVRDATQEHTMVHLEVKIYRPVQGKEFIQEFIETPPATIMQSN